MAGLACICSSLVALVATIVRQIRNNYTKSERKQWPALVLIMGSISILWGLLVLANSNPALSSTGYIMIGLGLVCYSISSKVILLAISNRKAERNRQARAVKTGISGMRLASLKVFRQMVASSMTLLEML